MKGDLVMRISILIFFIVIFSFLFTLNSSVVNLQRAVLVLQEGVILLLDLQEQSNTMCIDKNFFISVDPKQNWIKIRTDPRYLKFSTGS